MNMKLLYYNYFYNQFAGLLLLLTRIKITITRCFVKNFTFNVKL